MTTTVPGATPEQSIPIIPGEPAEPVMLAEAPPVPAPAPAPTRWWQQPIMIGLIVAAVAIVTAVLVRVGPGGSSDPGTPPAQAALPAAASSCGLYHSSGIVTLGDADKTITFDMAGKDSGTGEGSFAELQCLMTALGTPDAVWQEMIQTRALDGRRSGSWGNYSASWTYHPDDGLDVIITER